MTYPKPPNLQRLAGQIALFAQLKHEYGAKNIAAVLAKAQKAMRASLAEMKKLPIDKDLAKREPNGLKAIQRLRPAGPRRMWKTFDKPAYRERIEGALLGRFAGCTLGSVVEFRPIEEMENLAQENGEAFPPIDYWTRVPHALAKRYKTTPRRCYTRDGMNGVPVDDDLAYTLLGLLVLEDFGPDFTIEDVGKAWLKYLPFACTAERVALDNLRQGVSAKKAADKDNPYCEWIGADIRSDPWGYLAPGWPERAADMAYRDAYVSHRRQGIYGEMYFSAAISAGFAVDDPIEALELGLTEIPKDCAMAKIVRWALRVAPQITNYREAREAMEEKCRGMHRTHTLNNALLTIWGVTIGGTDFTKVIGETVAMGGDNDCTAATAGSLVGAVIGKQGIPEHWYRSFNNTVHSYLIKKPKFSISALLKRFTKEAGRVHGG